MTKTLEEFDKGRDEAAIAALERADDLARTARILEDAAIRAALMTHPVTKFVLSAAVQDTKYPAISDSYHGLFKLITGKTARTNRHARNADGTDVPNMVWSLPGQNRKTACGVHRSNSGELAVKMCTEEPKHYLKAVSSHCGSLRCRNCMNWTAMLTGVNLEERICTPADIIGRKTGFYDVPKHWAISPPQEWFKRIMQRSDHFSALVDDLVKLLPAFGFYAGVLVVHPWRLSEDGSEWIFSPHFHAVGYGRFDNMGLRAALRFADSRAGGIWNDDGQSESWVFNQIHPDEELKSVRHTIGYIMTHAGIGTFDHDVDWIDAADRISIPIESGKGTAAQRAKTIKPYMIEGDAWKDNNFWPEHLDEFDWLKWTEDQCTGSIPVYRVFGKVSKVRTVCDFKERVPRVCPDCGAPVGRFDSVLSLQWEPVMYERSSKIRAMSDDVDKAREELDLKRDDLQSVGLDILDAAQKVACCSTPETKGLQEMQRLKTPDEKAARFDRKVAYVPSRYGQGWDPVILSSEGYAYWKRTGELPEGTVISDSIVSFDTDDCRDMKDGMVSDGSDTVRDTSGFRKDPDTGLPVSELRRASEKLDSLKASGGSSTSGSFSAGAIGLDVKGPSADSHNGGD